MPPALRVLAYGAALTGGFASGVLGSFVHSFTSYGAPVGVILGLALSVAIFAWSGVATSSRRGAAVAVASWMLPVLVLSVRRDEGDLIVAGTVLGYTWLVGGMVVAGMTLTWPYGASAFGERAVPPHESR